MRSKVTLEQAEEIRQRVRAGESQISVARSFGISQSVVGRIHLGQSLTGRPRKNAMREHRLTEAQIRRLRDAWADGVTRDDLSARFEVSTGVVFQLCQGVERSAA